MFKRCGSFFEISIHALVFTILPVIGAEAGSESHVVAQHLLLDFLADRHQQKDAALSASARSFLTCRLFADELTAVRDVADAAPSNKQQSQLLLRYQNTKEQLEKGLVCELEAGRVAESAICPDASLSK